MKALKLIDKVNGFLKRGGWGELDERNACMIRKGNATIAVVAVPDKDLLMVASPVVTLPGENLLPLFRKLLILNFTETKDAAFALNEDAGTIDLQIKRPLQHLEYEEFERAVATVAEMADSYNDPLAAKFGSDVVRPQAAAGGRWKSAIAALNPFTTIVRREDLQSRTRRIRAVFSVIGLIAAIGAAVLAYERSNSWALAIFTFMWTQYIVVRIIPDLITDPDKFRRLIFFGLHPAVAVGLLYLTYRWWGMMWLSAVIGYLGGVFLARLIGVILTPRVALEETRDEQERMKGWLGSQSRR